MKYTIAFDVYGTLIDTSGVFNSLERLMGEQANTFMDTWRNKQLEYSFRRGLMNKYVDFALCTKHALSFSCQFHHVELTESQKEALMKEYTILPAFPDVREALEALKKAGHQLFAFSNGSKKAVSGLLSHAKIIDLFDGVISVENMETFKPNPTVYEYFNRQSKSEKNSAWLISGNPFDVIGAISYGMRAAWVQRSPKTIFDPWGIEPTAIVNTLTDLSAKLEKNPY
ncbi:MAG: 2-haloacid dehalogenase [Marivirga sp.]|jgi:2-haloacid dehalogenase